MKPTVVLSAFNVANFPEGGGHFWVYMQYALGLRQCGCDVTWMERYVLGADERRDAAAIATFFERMESFGFGGRAFLVVAPEAGAKWAQSTILGATSGEADAVIRRADLLLNFHYAIEPELLGRFRRSALVDIDPGLFQFWLSRGQLAVPPHDRYFTTGETVGEAGSAIPDCGLPWVHIRPCVSLEDWEFAYDPGLEAMTTVSAWSSGDWVKDDVVRYENSKRAAFLAFKDLPKHTHQPLELALFMVTDEDLEEQCLMLRHGWRVRPSRDVAGSPAAYRSYIRRSRGEFACAKRSCMEFQNAWVSDRTLCYLASGKPVVVQHTGSSRYLPDGEGMFRFRTIEEAAAALESVNADYERHCRAARSLAEKHFDAKQVTARILEVALG
jgi:hypothetical protein